MWEPQAVDQNHHANWISKESQTRSCDPVNYINIGFWKFVFQYLTIKDVLLLFS